MTFQHGTFAGREKLANQPIVLIVEDDEAIQAIVEDALKEGGFETAIAPSAEEAVTLLKGKVMDYRALVTDINLKGRMNGWEVAKQARQIDPTFPIVYMTGAAANDWASHGVRCWWQSGKRRLLLNHLVGSAEQRRRHG
jgi:CheY-like chemotaxis protein